jgi:hypothetical protein
MAMPAQGIVENAGGKVVVRRLDGTVATELLGMQVDESSSPVQAPRLLTSDGKAYRLSRQRLRPDTSSNGDGRFSGDGPRPSLPAPPRSGTGHWRYVFSNKAGAALAQWSGECELPIAYDIVEGQPVGLGPSGAPVESVALGLGADGVAVVLFPRNGCATGSARQGVYVRHPARGWHQVSTALAARYFRG